MANEKLIRIIYDTYNGVKYLKEGLNRIEDSQEKLRESLHERMVLAENKINDHYVANSKQHDRIHERINEIETTIENEPVKKAAKMWSILKDASKWLLALLVSAGVGAFFMWLVG